MPQIIVTADRGEGTETWRERINASDFESEHFANQLVERLGWAVNDAHEVERDAGRRPLSTENEPHNPAEDAPPTSAEEAPPTSAEDPPRTPVTR